MAPLKDVGEVSGPASIRRCNFNQGLKMVRGEDRCRDDVDKAFPGLGSSQRLQEIKSNTNSRKGATQKIRFLRKGQRKGGRCSLCVAALWVG